VAKTCAKIAGTKVVFDLPDEVEAKGFSQPNNCILNNSKLRDLGWEGKYSLKDGLVETLEYLRGN
jgi:UDP-glucuronate decarboxylase